VALLALRPAAAIGSRLHRAAHALVQVVNDVADGQPRLPEWISTDEAGDVAFALARVGEKLEGIAQSLQHAGLLLTKSAEQLARSSSEQGDTLNRQSAALHETQVTAQEIRQTSQLASTKAQEVLELAEKADAIRASGESAVQQSIGGLEDISRQVEDMTIRMRDLAERARQIEVITSSVKDLADQSNMLALNVQATGQARAVLEGVREAIESAARMSDEGHRRVTTSVTQVRSWGAQLGALTSIVEQNAAAVRQIAGAVTQQHAGTSQIFQAIEELSSMMDESLSRVQASEETTQLVETVALEVSGAVEQFGGRNAKQAA
jgi:methyl-accepting chemotaxis protein